MRSRQAFALAFLLLCAVTNIIAQEVDSSFGEFSADKYISAVTKKAGRLQHDLDRANLKVLRKFQRLESRILRRLARVDSLKAKEVFGNSDANYRKLSQKPDVSPALQQYIPSLDTFSTSLKFLRQHSSLLARTPGLEQKIRDATAHINGLEGKLQHAEDIGKFLKERREYLRNHLSSLGFAKELKAINKQAYYYSAQLNEYKSLLKDRKKAEKKALELLSNTKMFKDFMRKNSVLASLFRLPGDPNDPNASQISLAGLQTRAQVNGLIQQQVASGGPNARQQFRQNLQSAQSEINQLKDKLLKAGSGSSDEIMPEGFKPNTQRAKSFFKRLELGTNIQSQKANGYFPVTSDIGLSLGYRLNDNSIIGVGSSYKIGWGQNIRHVNITHQGVGLRSFVDWKIKGSFWVSGGYEMNYRSEFDNVEQLRNLNAWQQSGLIGVSKVVSLKTKFFKRTKLQLLWDFLSYRQVPQTRPVIMRINYTLN